MSLSSLNDQLKKIAQPALSIVNPAVDEAHCSKCRFSGGNVFVNLLIGLMFIMHDVFKIIESGSISESKTSVVVMTRKVSQKLMQCLVSKLKTSAHTHVIPGNHDSITEFHWSFVFS